MEARLAELDRLAPSEGEGVAVGYGTSDGMSLAFGSHGDLHARHEQPPVAPPSAFVGPRAERMRRLGEDSFSAMPDVLPLDPQPWVDTRPSTAFIERGHPSRTACVRDGSGAIITWPWEAPEGRLDGGYQPPPKRHRAPHRTDALRST